MAEYLARQSEEQGVSLDAREHVPYGHGLVYPDLSAYFAQDSRGKSPRQLSPGLRFATAGAAWRPPSRARAPEAVTPRQLPERASGPDPLALKSPHALESPQHD